MEPKVVVSRQPRGGANVKSDSAQGKNRQVLRDIGNLEILKEVEGKISRPITRGFRAKFLANAKAAAEKHELIVVDGGVPAIRKGRALRKAAEAQKKEFEDLKHGSTTVISSDEKENFKVDSQNNLPEKPTPETVILISSNEEGIAKAAGQRSKEMPTKVKAFTSILTARSKAAGGITYKQKDLIVNIDAADVNDELAVVEYVDDIYLFYKHAEDESRMLDYRSFQPINERMRAILVDWLIEVHNRFELTPETLYLTVNIFDRYLSRKTVRTRVLQLVGISSMLIACKYEEIWAPLVEDFLCISDYAYVGEEVRAMEKEILGELGWYLTVPTPYVFLVRYLKASVLPDKEMENMVSFLAELGITDYSTVVSYCPSMLAAAAVYAARCTLNKSPFWTATLMHHTGYCEEQLKDCAKLLVSFHMQAAESERKIGVYKKFSSPNRGAVSLFTPAKDLLAISS